MTERSNASKLLEASRRRRNATRDRIDAAKAIAIRLIEASGGIYPQNGGRLTQAEVCRLGKVAPSLLAQPAHANTTRVELNRWLADLRRSGMLRPANPPAGAAADSVASWKRHYEQLLTQFHVVELELEQCRADLDALRKATMPEITLGNAESATTEVQGRFPPKVTALLATPTTGRARRTRKW